jgi:hypothetical protein
LVTGMKWFRGVYTQWSNGRHKLFGHLFQGGYKALLVEQEGEYFATVLIAIEDLSRLAQRDEVEAGGGDFTAIDPFQRLGIEL